MASLGRLENGLRQAGDWYHWGPYLSERQWGTVREDYSAARDCVGIPATRSRSVTGLPLGRGRPRRLLGRRAAPLPRARALERARPDPEGAHLRAHRAIRETTARTPRSTGGTSTPPRATRGTAGATTTRRAPTRTRISSTRTRPRGKQDPEYELLDTGIFDDDRYWIVEADYAKADPHDLLLTMRVTNPGPDADTLHVLPTAWYRNTWAWEGDGQAPELSAAGGVVDDGASVPRRTRVPRRRGAGRHRARAALLQQRDERRADLRHAGDRPSRRTGSTITSSPVRTRSTRKAWHEGGVLVPRPVSSGATVELRLRLRPTGSQESAVVADFDEVVAARRREADEFYAELTPPRRLGR